MSEASIPEYDEPLPAVDRVIGRQHIMANQKRPVRAGRFAFGIAYVPVGGPLRLHGLERIRLLTFKRNSRKSH